MAASHSILRTELSSGFPLARDTRFSVSRGLSALSRCHRLGGTILWSVGIASMSSSRRRKTSSSCSIVAAARKSPAGPLRPGPEFAVRHRIDIDCRHGGLLCHANHIALILVRGIDPFVTWAAPFGLGLIHAFRAHRRAAVQLNCSPLEGGSRSIGLASSPASRGCARTGDARQRHLQRQSRG